MESLGAASPGLLDSREGRGAGCCKPRARRHRVFACLLPASLALPVAIDYKPQSAQQSSVCAAQVSRFRI
ncbi:hypothetical protein GCM10023144_30370 [Pigmentiphaga soli]|uniref:Uncharacterized protein n=1 Tax=Pigmentiphaga soli TaxID=1007095 RepID=A0ABP8H9U6_9BURK